MLRQILDYQFNLQGQPIDRSGQNNHGIATAIVGTSGPGDVRAVGFLAPSSRIDIPFRTCWSHLNAVQIETRVMLRALDHRVNLIEIERSLALFVRSDGVVTFTYLAPETADDDDDGGVDPTGDINSFTAFPTPAGSVDPFDTLTSNPPPPPDPFVWQGLNTDVEFSPDGVRRTVPLNEYVTIRAVHDGFATMRIYIDGDLAGERTDIVFGVPPLLAPGIVAVGAWPHDGRYTLNGSIDYLQLWREDPEFPYQQFFCRDMSAEAEGCWHDFFKRLSACFDDPDERPAILKLLRCVSDMQTRLARAIARAGEAEREELRMLSNAYLRLWCAGDVDGEAMAVRLQGFVALFERVDPDGFANLLPDLLACFTDPKVKAICDLATDIPGCDPGWGKYVDAVGGVLPNPICPPPPADDDPKRKRRKPYPKDDRRQTDPKGAENAYR